MNPTLTEPVAPEDLEKARRDFRRMLRCKRLSRRWIEEHAEDLLAQAQVEYAARLAEGKAAHSVVGWLVNGAWWRAQDLLESQGRKEPTCSIEAAFHLADESEEGPERAALRHDRAERLRGALSELPEKDRRLLALVYFGGESIRAAGRTLGWQKSAADRHHGEALERLRHLLGDDRSALSPAGLGLAAWIAVEADGSRGLARAARALGAPLHRALAELGELSSGATQRMAGPWRRLTPFADPAAAAGGSGGGRALGACGVAAATVLCGVAAGGVVPAAIPHGRPAKPDPGPSVQTAAPTAAQSFQAPAAAPEGSPQSAKTESPAPEASTQKLRKAKAAHRNAGAQPTGEGKPTPVASEFGAEAAATPQPAGTPSPATAQRPSGSTSSEAVSPSSAQDSSPSTSSPKGSGGSSSGSGSSAEFGL